MSHGGQVGQRHGPLDLLRGVAALGILLINIRFMGAASFEPLPGGQPSWLDSDWLIWGAAAITLEGAMRGLFTLLFGAGILLATQKAGSGDRMLARALGLLALGAVNAVALLWPGDVLFLYALCVPALLLVRSWSLSGLMAAALALLAGSVLLQVQRDHGVRMDLARGLEAEIAADSGQTLSAEQWRALAAREKALLVAGATSAAAQAEETAARQGSYLQAAAWSAGQWQRATLGPFLAGGALETLAMMLLGMVLLRWWLARSSVPGLWRMAALGYGLGLPAKCWMVAAAIHGDGGAIWLSAVLEHIGRTAMTVGHAGAIMMLIGTTSSVAGRFAGALACVGRLALSNYLLASVLAGLWFWGFGQWGRLDWASLWLVAIGIWGVQLGASRWWERRFGAGPAERLLWAFSQLGNPAAGAKPAIIGARAVQ